MITPFWADQSWFLGIMHLTTEPPRHILTISVDPEKSSDQGSNPKGHEMHLTDSFEAHIVV